MKSLANNLINGNIAQARIQARRYTSFRISMYLRQIVGWSFNRSVLAAHFLKTGSNWQLYCDAE